jgi:superfamily II DNA or RNA helicase
MFKFRDYQLNIINRAKDVIRKHKFVYLSMEVRTGKTLTSLGISEALDCKDVLFVTKKKAISSIEQDFLLLNSSMNLVVINYESLHKIELPNCDMLILDEAHGMGAFPKPSKRAKLVRLLIKKYSPFVCLKTKCFLLLL